MLPSSFGVLHKACVGLAIATLTNLGKVASAYMDIKSQMGVAALICGNFLVNIVESPGMQRAAKPGQSYRVEGLIGPSWASSRYSGGPNIGQT